MRGMFADTVVWPKEGSAGGHFFGDIGRPLPPRLLHPLKKMGLAIELLFAARCVPEIVELERFHGRLFEK